MSLKVRNWSKFQHYKDRCPPWIKLATDTFQNYEFSRLSDASKLLALCIWTLAARSREGEVPDDFAFLKSQGCLGDSVKEKNLTELISSGFLERSNLLASCEQSACSEGEGETEERRGRGRGRGRDSSAPPADAEPALLVFPCVGSGESEWNLTQSAVEAWADTWPGVDILAESKKALAWLNAKPERRKTHRGMPAFLTGWYGRTQDTGGTRVARPGANGSVLGPSPKRSDYCDDHLDGRSKLWSSRPTATCPECRHQRAMHPKHPRVVTMEQLFSNGESK